MKQSNSMSKRGKLDVDSFTGQFATTDWLRIIQALKFYVIVEEETLRKQNVGDREWQELEEYSTLAKDIELYVISKSNE